MENHVLHFSQKQLKQGGKRGKGKGDHHNHPTLPVYLDRWQYYCISGSPATTRYTVSRKAMRHRSEFAPGYPAHRSVSTHSTGTTLLLQDRLVKKQRREYKTYQENDEFSHCHNSPTDKPSHALLDCVRPRPDCICGNSYCSSDPDESGKSPSIPVLH